MLTSIIVLAYNKLEYTKLCIDSIRQYTKPGSYELIVVDNGSTDGTGEWLRQQPDIKSLSFYPNIGATRAFNEGLKVSQGDNIVWTNNDTVLTENWCDNLITCLYSDDNIGIVCPVTNYCSNYQSISVPYKDISQMHEFAKSYNISNPAKWEERVRLVAVCWMIKRKVIDEIGMLDERFNPGNFEDDDYSMRTRKAGYRLILCKDTFFHHFGSTTFRDDRGKFASLLRTNLQKFQDKWGFSSWADTVIRYDLIEAMEIPQARELRVLEADCGCGATLLKIREIQNNAKLYGVEQNKPASEFANLIAEVETGDIQTIEMEYPNSSFDYILISEALERSYYPKEVLGRVKNLLRPGGAVITSLANMLYFKTVGDFLNGVWPYDQNNIRFYNLTEIYRLFAESGYEIVRVLPRLAYVTESDKEFISQLTSITPFVKNPNYNVWQYTVRAVPS